MKVPIPQQIAAGFTIVSIGAIANTAIFYHAYRIEMLQELPQKIPQIVGLLGGLPSFLVIPISFLIASVLVFALLGWLYYLLIYDIPKRQRVEAELRQSYKEMTELYTRCSTRDSSDRQQAKQDLANLSVRLQSVLDAATEVSIIATDLNGTITVFNAGAEKMLGYAADEMVGKQTPALIHLDSEMARRGQELSQEFGYAIQGFDVFVTYANQGKAESREWIYVKKDGTHIPVNLVMTAVRNSEGNITGFLGIAQDITERQRAAAALRKAKNELELRVIQRTAELMRSNHQLQLELEERRRAQAALQLSQERFAGILEIASDAIISVDANQHIILFNQGAEKIFGYEAEEVMGKPLDLLLPVPLVEVHRQHVITFDSSGRETSKMDDRREIFGRRHDGTEFPAEASISKLEMGDETVFTAILRDVSDRKIVERMKNEFISVVSHELRTPLTSIHGALGLLNSGSLSSQPEKSQRLLAIAVDSTERLSCLLDDILDIERIELGKFMMAKVRCNAADLIATAASSMQTMAELAGIALVTSPLSVELVADPDRIIQTLTNLIGNAIKFSSPGSKVWLSAEVKTYPYDLSLGNRARSSSTRSSIPKAEILFQVRDWGRGIPADKLEKIFGRFQQVDASDSRDREGTGLGLAICRSIVQEHEGQIWVESRQGEGSTFYFTLPLLPDPDRR